MLIDWFTVGAQIVNFLVLVFLLKHFLYGPVIRAMDRREARIAERLEEAAGKRAEAEAETEKFQKKNAEFDERKSRLLSQAREAAEQEKKDMIEKARRDADDLRGKWLKAVEDGKQAFLRDLKRRTGTQVCEIAGRALEDLSNVSLEDHIIDVFLDERGKFRDAMERIKASAGSEEKVIVTSAFEMTVEKRQKITEKIQAAVTADLKTSFRTSSDLICGIELRMDNFTAGWNLKDYIKVLEDEISAMIEAGTGKGRGVERINGEDEK